MLQGTLDVFSLDEVLGLLSGANKSGVLNITGDRGVGTISIADGKLVGGSASSAPTAHELHDVVFELLRFAEGSFSFDGDTIPEGDAEELETVLVAAHSRLGEWQGIEAVVPSLDHHLELNADLPTSQVTLSEAEWATIVAIGEGASVGVVAERLGLGEFDGSKRVKNLIERNLTTITAGAPSPSPASEVAESFASPVFETPEPAPASFDEIGTVDDEIGTADTPEPVELPSFDEPVAETNETTAIEADAEPIEAPSFEAPSFEAPSFDEPAADEPVAEEIPPMPEAPAFGSFDEPVAEEIPPMPEAPAFGSFDEPVADEIPPMPEAPAFDEPVAEEIPPMPEAPAFGSFDEPVADEVPPMPAPPASFADEALDSPMPPPPAPPVGEPAPFGGLDAGGLEAMEPADMFEPPRRAEDQPAADEDSGMPSFAPPVSFDAEAFAVNDPEAMESETAEASVEADAEGAEKGGSLLMRYLKSNS